MWECAQYHIKHSWFFKYDAENYANISQICDYLGKDFCKSILAFHARKVSDATSYLFRAGKVKTFKKILSNQTKLKLILDSVELAIKRVHMQTFTWLRYCE